jgi:hypothetical protein
MIKSYILRVQGVMDFMGKCAFAKKDDGSSAKSNPGTFK